MKTVSLSGSPRENVGKKDAKSLRAEKRVPCVIYGGEKQTHFSVDLIEISKYVYTADVFKFDLDIDGQKVEAILKDIQFDPVTDRMIHADFLEIVDGKPVRMEIPMHVTGNSIGVKNGGRLSTNFRRIQVMGMPKDFPDYIEMDVTPLRIGMSLRIKDINLPDVTLLHNPESVVVGVRTARGAIEDEETEEGEEDEEGEEGEESSAEGETEEAKSEE